MKFPRSSGVLCHITSLPGGHGVGDLGRAAYEFVDFLKTAGQRVWQILPLVPPSEGDSPYSGYSAFAGNAILISLDQLVSDGLLSAEDVAIGDDSSGKEKVDYESVAVFKRSRLRKAFDSFRENATEQQRDTHDQFVRTTDWLNEFARFEALMLYFDQPDWSQWPEELVRRQDEALVLWDDRLRDEIAFSKWLQFVFVQQWQALKSYANQNGVSMYGDMPIFVAHQSADVWANQSLFALTPAGKPNLVAGVPPDYFSKTGQLWGNPQYCWNVLEDTDYAWWTDRFQGAFEQFDYLRIDHFRGFEAYWEVPATARTAVGGRWVKGPGASPFRAAAAKLGPLKMIAEDLGMITEEVHQLRDQLGFPGMRVFQFGFDTIDDDYHRPESYPEHSFAYTGTHDNDTLMGWFKNRPKRDSEDDPLSVVVGDSDNPQWSMIEAVLESASDVAIIPIQDILGLDNSARMNIPGKAKGNWSWRLLPGSLTTDVSKRLETATSQAKR